jgi:hypothetical protein
MKVGGRSPKVSIAVTAAGTTPQGKVRVQVDGKSVKTLVLKGGKASSRISNLKKGKHRITVRYVGSAAVAGKSTIAGTVKVKPSRR